MEYFKLLPFAIFLYFNFILNLNCFGPKPANLVSPSLNNEPANAESQKSINKQLIGSNSSSLNEPVAKIGVVNRQGSSEKTNNTTQNKINNPTQKMDKINKSIKILKHAISLNTSDEIKDAIINLETVCEFYVERRMNNSIKSLITGKDINDII